MTIQEILKMDSTILIQVGAAQLQKILNTMNMYKDYLEVAEEALAEKNQVIEKLRLELKHQYAENEKLKNTSVTIRAISEITGY